MNLADLQLQRRTWRGQDPCPQRRWLQRRRLGSGAREAPSRQPTLKSFEDVRVTKKEPWWSSPLSRTPALAGSWATPTFTDGSERLETRQCAELSPGRMAEQITA